MSNEDIERGARWNIELVSRLEKARFRLICLTLDNIEKPWILFEAGALTKSLENYAFTYKEIIENYKSNCVRPPHPKGRDMLRAARRPVFGISEIIEPSLLIFP
jgi:hypothetical protein